MSRVAAYVLMAAAGLWSSDASSAALPQHDDRIHEGVASCASSVCHGSQTERHGTTVLQNEFATWTRYDAHAGAFDVLRNEASVRMARKLGLANAHEADICLDCHADNVPMAQRGEAFQISDGVGCEACHGGAQDWLASHTAEGVSHADNVEAGLYPAADLGARAQLCLSCHLGTGDKFATHRIMGAGHPRLAFELNTFQALQPPHWAMDDDYVERKGDSEPFVVWADGLVSAAQRSLALLQGPLFHAAGVFPEVALFDCHACHHPMSEQRWTPTTARQGLPPGAIRLNDAHLLLLLPIAAVLDPGLHERLLDEIGDLNRSVVEGHEAVDAASGALLASIDDLAAVTARGVDGGRQALVLDAVLARAGRGDYRDYVAAEQAAMAMDVLLLSTGRWQTMRPRVDEVFATVADDEAYRPERFAAAARALRQAL